jgi:hypothetical protein
MDIQILQKVLPKLHGNRKQLEIPLARLIRFCFNADFRNRSLALTAEEKQVLSVYDFKNRISKQSEVVEGSIPEYPAVELIGTDAYAIFPRSASKLYRMLDVLEKQGYTSYIE